MWGVAETFVLFQEERNCSHVLRHAHRIGHRSCSREKGRIGGSADIHRVSAHLCFCDVMDASSSCRFADILALALTLGNNFCERRRVTEKDERNSICLDPVSIR
jgi:hypothetical protein